MTDDCDRRRILLIGSDDGRRALLGVFAGERLSAYEAVHASSFVQARFILQHQPCDVLLLDQHFLYGEEPVFGWLTAQHRMPVLLLSDAGAEQAALALEHGANAWLPRRLALDHPPLLAAALEQLTDQADLRRRARLAGEALHDSRRQVNRLVGLLWDAAPTHAHARWFTQRHMLERLEEEVARADRYGTPLAIVLGEFGDAAADGLDAPPREAAALAAWTAERIGAAMRRQDVAGQYGPRGFMLLLGHTAEPGAITCCRRLDAILQHSPLPHGGLRGPVHAHFGVAGFSEQTRTPKGLLSRAEHRLERERTSGAALAML